MVHPLMMLLESWYLILVVLCVKSIFPGMRTLTSMLVSEKPLVIFSLLASNIHFSFYLPHNIEIKEAKSVCPLESIVTTAITQVIWPKLRLPAWFFYASTSRQQKMERVAHKKAKCSRGTSWKRSLIHRELFQDQFQSIVNTPRDRNIRCHLFIQNVLMVCVWMLPKAGVGD